MHTIAIFELAFNVFLLSSSILLLMISFILHIIRMAPVRRLSLLSMFIFFCSLWFLIRNSLLDLGVRHQPALEMIDILCQYGITFFALLYVREFIGGWRRKAIEFCVGWTVLFILATSIFQFFTDLNYSDALPVGAICNAIFIMLMEICIGWETFREKNGETKKLFLSSVPILAGGFLEICNFLTKRVFPTTILFFIGFFIFMFLQIFWFIKYLQEQAEKSAKLEQELMEARISTMLSQIQPHFLYNSLVGIKQLCDTKPQKASIALEHFAYYLRGNLYSISNESLIPFSKEVQHVEDYLYLEKMRFEDRLNIQWQIEFTDFFIPSLSLQPIVENAVRHGITKKKGGGTLTIKSALHENTIHITVLDDGVGFDITAIPDNSRPHIGLDNVRRRLKTQCQGALQVYSTPGKGTEITMILPTGK